MSRLLLDSITLVELSAGGEISYCHCRHIRVWHRVIFGTLAALHVYCL